MRKEDRQKIFDKYGGRCAYCGCELQKGWHVDEIEPVRRKFTRQSGYFKEGRNKLTLQQVKDLSEEQMVSRGIKWIDSKLIPSGYENPENFHIDNQNPACASCNINKHSGSLEEFRQMIAHFITTLNRDNTQYKIAKRYGLIQETGIVVKFFFETPNSDPNDAVSDTTGDDSSNEDGKHKK